MVDAWPTGDCPFYAERGSWRGSVDDAIAEFRPEVGPPKTRRRTWLPSRSVSFTMMLTTAELAALEEFYEEDLKNGALTFSATDPQLASTQEYKFVSPPTHSDVGYDRWRIDMKLRRLPS